MQCPHCLNAVHEGWEKVRDLDGDADHQRKTINVMKCPACGRWLVAMTTLAVRAGGPDTPAVPQMATADLYPRTSGRPPPPSEVPNPFAQEYREACLVLRDSPKASAALSRRCLQLILREKAGVKPADLSREIDEAMPSLPPYLAGAIDAVRSIGNFAAHPIKSKSSGEVVDVEPGEAEWLLDVLEGLFAFYFVEPAALKAKRDELNAKLEDIGKPPLKGPAPG